MFDNILGVDVWKLCVSLSFIFVAIMVYRNRPKDKRITIFQAIIFSFLILFLTFIFSRLVHILCHWEYYMTTFYKGGVHLSLERFVFGGGHVLLASLVGVFLAVLIFTKIVVKRLKFWEFMDYFMPFSFLFFGGMRIGCFLAGCCHGHPTTSFIGVAFHPPSTVRYIPTQLFESICCFSIFIVMRHINKKGSVPGGIVTFSSLAIYGCLRFFNDFFRADNIYIDGVSFLSLGKIVSLCMVLLCAFSVFLIIWYNGNLKSGR